MGISLDLKVFWRRAELLCMYCVIFCRPNSVSMSNQHASHPVWHETHARRRQGANYIQDDDRRKETFFTRGSSMCSYRRPSRPLARPGSSFLQPHRLGARGGLNEGVKVGVLGGGEVAREFALGVVDAETAGVVGRIGRSAGGAGVGKGGGSGGVEALGRPRAAAGAQDVELPVRRVADRRRQTV